MAEKIGISSDAKAGFTKKFHKDNRAVAELTQPLTLPYVDALLPQMLELFSECELIAIDLAGVTEIDSAGLQFLTVLKKTAVIQQKKLKFINHSAAVIDLMEVYGVVGLFRDKIILPTGSQKDGRFQYGLEIQQLA